jgi:hypothetical protein
MSGRFSVGWALSPMTDVVGCAGEAPRDVPLRPAVKMGEFGVSD